MSLTTSTDAVSVPAMSLLEAIRSQRDERPTAPAVRDAAGQLTREELGARSDAVAAELVKGGVEPGDRVYVSARRSVALVVSVLGVLKAHATYVPADPAYPAERLSWILTDSQAVAAITDVQDASETIAAEAHHLRLGLTMLSNGAISSVRCDPARSRPEASPARSAGEHDAAYVIYTSGSTGRPKGVSVSHAGLLHLVGWHIDAFGLGEDDRCSQIASPGFDAAVWEIWPSLVAGAGLHIVPDEVRLDPHDLRRWLVAERITVGFIPTAVADGLIRLSWPADTTLRWMLTGGDALARRPAADLPFGLVNNYGVTEATVVTTSGVVTASDTGPISIGRPIAGVEIRIVDVTGQPAPEGAPGELLVGGVMVAQGYINRPELNAERFFDDGQGRWFRTGDLVRQVSGGALEFRGRLDDQLSIRGFRVEPAEVSVALNRHPRVRASAAGASGSGPGVRLVAYVVAADGSRATDAELDAFLGQILPEHMRPSQYVWVPSIPMTDHGKVDRAALARLSVSTASTPAPAPPALSEPVVAPAPGLLGLEDVEGMIAENIADLLGLASVGLDENFFLRGGHSLLAAQLITRVDEIFDVEMSVRFLFFHPTARELAAEVMSQRAEDGVGQALS